MAMKISGPKYLPFFFLLFGIAVSGFFSVPSVRGDDLQDCAELSGDEKDRCEEYNVKIRSYQKIIDLKRTQGEVLSDQIDVLGAQTAKLELEIGNAEKKAGAVMTQIGEAEARIAEKERVIALEKGILSEMIRGYRDGEDDGTGVFLAVAGGDFGDFFSKKDDWMLETNGRIVGILRDLAITKKSLEEEREKLSGKKKELEDLKVELGEKNDALESSRQNKASLLVKTMSEQEKYEDLLEKVRKQKEELFDFAAAGNLAEIFGSLDSYDKPDKKYQASTSWYYSQRDSRWSDEEIGRTESKMGDWGCAVTSVAMAFTELGSRVSPGTLANKNSLFDRDLIIWPSSWNGGIERVSSTSHGNVDWKTVDSEIGDGNPVIVYIRRARGGGHYVVIHHKDNKGRYVVHDPYFGPNLFLDTSRSLVGKLGTASSTKIDQMIIYND
jgi:peptidoglycan hydrolase CwlO-like protein